MKLKPLKKVRVIISLFFFSAMLVLFLDLSFSIPAVLSEYITYFQFIPSLVKFLSAGTLAAAGFIFVLALTLLFGRAYCSFLCPLGTLQDIISHVRKKVIKTGYSYEKPGNRIRYTILTATALVFLSGSIIGLTFLDPYSNFGRIITHTVRPLAAGIKNALAYALAKINIYSVYPLDLKGTTAFSLVFSIGFLCMILWMTVRHGRLFCNTFCPVGTLLGFISRFSVYKIVFNRSECIRCNACERVCKSACIDVEKGAVDFSRCVACYNCLSACPSSGVAYQSCFRETGAEDLKDTEKRNFILQAAAFLLAYAAPAFASQRQIETYMDSLGPVIKKTPISPPGSVSPSHFKERCTACHLCVSACPTQVLQPAFLEYGLSGIMKPRMDYNISFCNYDCTVCSRVCPTGAISPLSSESKKQIQLGRPKFIRENCVIYIRKTDCGACAEHCPTKAVHMAIDPEIGRNAPMINEKICIGCGACEFACPTKPHRAIYVEGNLLHAKAEKPEEERVLDFEGTKSDFPF